MKLDEIQAEIEKDSEIDNNRIDFESLKIPSLHAKYYRIYAEELSRLKAMQFEVFAIRKSRMEYYMGRASDEDYQEEPLDHKILKTDLDVYMDADEKLSAAKARMEFQKIKVDIVEKFIGSLNARGYNLKTALDYMKFKAGEY